MARFRLAVVMAAAALAVTLGACDALPPDASSSPAGGTPRPTAGPSTDDISAALDALDGLASYRFSQSVADIQAGPFAQARGVVVNGPERRLRVEYSAGGAFAGGQVSIGERTWLSVSSGTWQLQGDAGGFAGEWLNPVARAFDPWALGLDDVQDLGIEVHDGVSARHLRATAVADVTVDEDGFPTGSGFTGEADVWIAADGGWLVAARAVGTQAWPSAGGDDPSPTPSPTPYRIDIAVEGVNDPANLVEEPGTATATAAPAGDPAAVPLVKGIAGGLRALDSFVFTIRSSTGGMELTQTLTVVNRPERVAMLEPDAIAGLEVTAVLVTADQAWTRTGSGPWTPSRPADPVLCGSGGALTSELGGCTLERLADVGASIRPMRGTFTIVGTDEQVGGIAATHLRSQAGLEQAGVIIPGTRDVWIANDDGFLLLDVFTGFGLTTQAAIGRINDPANAIPVPGG